MYGGNEGAMKAAAHELKGLRAFAAGYAPSAVAGGVPDPSAPPEVKPEVFGTTTKLAAPSSVDGKAVNELTPMGSLRCPLMAVVDFRGFRCVACCALPIGGSTLIYGSDDQVRQADHRPSLPRVNTRCSRLFALQATTVHSDPEAVVQMEAAASTLGLAPHLVGPHGADDSKLVQVVGPADIEIHRGKDKRL